MSKFKDVLNVFNLYPSHEIESVALIYSNGGSISIGRVETIRRAMLIADKLMQDPSEAMIEAARNREEIGVPIYAEVFKAMRDQLLREVEK